MQILMPLWSLLSLAIFMAVPFLVIKYILSKISIQKGKPLYFCILLLGTVIGGFIIFILISGGFRAI